MKQWTLRDSYTDDAPYVDDTWDCAIIEDNAGARWMIQQGRSGNGIGRNCWSNGFGFKLPADAANEVTEICDDLEASGVHAEPWELARALDFDGREIMDGCAVAAIAAELGI